MVYSGGTSGNGTAVSLISGKAMDNCNIHWYENGDGTGNWLRENSARSIHTKMSQYQAPTVTVSYYNGDGYKFTTLAECTKEQPFDSWSVTTDKANSILTSKLQVAGRD
ncbi:MAG: hypothetical protein ACI4A3_02010 [Lachnospiraceae bacterium]